MNAINLDTWDLIVLSLKKEWKNPTRKISKIRKKRKLKLLRKIMTWIHQVIQKIKS